MFLRSHFGFMVSFTSKIKVQGVQCSCRLYDLENTRAMVWLRKGRRKTSVSRKLSKISFRLSAQLEPIIRNAHSLINTNSIFFFFCYTKYRPMLESLVSNFDTSNADTGNLVAS